MYIFNETDSPLLSLQTNREEYLMSKSSSDRYKGWNHKVYFTTGETGTIKIGFAQSIYDEDTYNTMYNDMLKYIKCNVLTNSENHTHGNLDLALADTKTRTVIRTEAKHTADTHFEKYMPEDAEYDYNDLSYEQAYANMNNIWHENLLLNTKVSSGILSSWKVWEEYDPGVALVQRTMRISRKINLAEFELNSPNGISSETAFWVGGPNSQMTYMIQVYPTHSNDVMLISSAHENAKDDNELFEYFNKNFKYSTTPFSSDQKNVKNAQVVNVKNGYICFYVPYYLGDEETKNAFKKWSKKYLSDLYIYEVNQSNVLSSNKYKQQYKPFMSKILDGDSWEVNGDVYEFELPNLKKGEGYRFSLPSKTYYNYDIQVRKNESVIHDYTFNDYNSRIEFVVQEDNVETFLRFDKAMSLKQRSDALNKIKIEKIFECEDKNNQSYCGSYNSGFHVNFNDDQKNNGFNTYAEYFLKKSGYGIDYVFEPEQADIFLYGNQNITSDMVGNAELNGKCAIPKTVDVSVVYPEYMNDTEEGHYDYFTNVNGQLNFTHFTPLWNPDGPYIPTAIIHDIWTPTGEIQYYWENDDVEIYSDLTKDWHIRHKSTVTPEK